MGARLRAPLDGQVPTALVATGHGCEATNELRAGGAKVFGGGGAAEATASRWPLSRQHLRHVARSRWTSIITYFR